MRQCLNKLIDEEIIDEVLEFRIKVKTPPLTQVAKKMLVTLYFIWVLMQEHF